MSIIFVFLFGGSVEIHYEDTAPQVVTTATIFNEGQHES